MTPSVNNKEHFLKLKNDILSNKSELNKLDYVNVDKLAFIIKKYDKKFKYYKNSKDNNREAVYKYFDADSEMNKVSTCDEILWKNLLLVYQLSMR